MIELELLRFSEDITPTYIDKQRLLDIDFREVIANAALEGVEVSLFLTPQIENILNTVCEAVQVPRPLIRMFVKNEQAVNAFCLNAADQLCVLVISSGLINLMSSDELKFVIGHELGHYIFQHSQFTYGSYDHFASRLRAAEISSDRIGLLACNDINIAMSAIIKVASGLDSEHLRVNVSAFIESAKAYEGMSDITQGYSHPTLAVRARALLHFQSVVSSIDDLNVSSMRKIDERVIRDFERFVDGIYRKSKSILQNELTKWKLAELLHFSNVEVKEVQKFLSHELGVNNTMEIITFLADEDSDGVSKDLTYRVAVIKEQLYAEYPNEASVIEDAALTRAYKLEKTVTQFNSDL